MFPLSWQCSRQLFRYQKRSLIVLTGASAGKTASVGFSFIFFNILISVSIGLMEEHFKKDTDMIKVVARV